MSQPTLVFVSETQEEDADLELVVNFGVYSAREATPAEIDRLGRSLLDELEAVEIICEQRYEFDDEVEATVYRIRVGIPRGRAGNAAALAELVEAWAQDCIGERRISI